MTRSAAVAGYFYSREADALRGEITALMREGAALRERQAPGLAGLFGQGTTLPGGARHPLMVLLPHAGYMYSGAVACAALAGVELPRRLIVLGPSHTGVGHMQGFWPEGAWRTPLGDIPVDAELGKELESLGGGFAPDIACHMREHAIEVLLPFLRFARPDCSILPVTIGMPSVPGGLAKAALALAEVLKRHAGEEGGPREVGLVVSSDMNHFENEAHTRELDEAAKIDGCSSFGILQYVLFPLCVPCWFWMLPCFCGKCTGGESACAGHCPPPWASWPAARWALPMRIFARTTLRPRHPATPAGWWDMPRLWCGEGDSRREQFNIGNCSLSRAERDAGAAIHLR